jgi:Ala-tRNA(Pro) deacylase
MRTNCLNTNKIPYEILPHAEAFTAGMAATAEQIARHHQAKVVMVSCQKGPAMTVVPADRKLDLRKLGRLTHERPVLQSEAEFAPVFPD